MEYLICEIKICLHSQLWLQMFINLGIFYWPSISRATWSKFSEGVARYWLRKITDCFKERKNVLNECAIGHKLEKQNYKSNFLPDAPRTSGSFNPEPMELIAELGMLILKFTWIFIYMVWYCSDACRRFSLQQ